MVIKGLNDMQYWLIVTSPENFKHNKDVLGFKILGLRRHYMKTVQRLQPEDRVVYYIKGLKKFGATATIIGTYYEDSTKVWTDERQIWPLRCPLKPNYILNFDDLLDAKKLINDLSFIELKTNWGSHFQGSIKQIPEQDFKLIETEIKKIVSERANIDISPNETHCFVPQTEADFEQAIMALPLQTTSLHERIIEMLEKVGSWMNYNIQRSHKIATNQAYKFDVVWFTGMKPEIAFEVQNRRNLIEAKDNLAKAKKFSYRKVILILQSVDMEQLNQLLQQEPELRNMMEAWSIGDVHKLYIAGEKFFKYYKLLIGSESKDNSQLEHIE